MAILYEKVLNQSPMVEILKGLLRESTMLSQANGGSFTYW